MTEPAPTEQQIKLKLAQQCATLFINQVDASGVVFDVQFMAVEIIIKTLIFNRIKPEKQVEITSKWIKAMGAGIRAEIKERSKAK